MRISNRETGWNWTDSPRSLVETCTTIEAASTSPLPLLPPSLAMSKEVESQIPAEGTTARRGSVSQTEKGRWERLWPVLACGAGLFSDGYLNNVRLEFHGQRGDSTDKLDRSSAP